VYIKSLKINNLRNIKSVDLNLHPKLNFLLGDNGAGKTSVLESIVVLAKGRSFRSGQITSLLGPDSDQFRVVAGTCLPDSSQQVLGIERSRLEWRARKDGEDVKQLSDLARHLPLVLIEPNSHLLVSGPPDGRRRFLDWGVFHVEHDYLMLWRRYSRALKQRNAALRKQDRGMIESLDSILAELGEQINVVRSKQQTSLAEKLKEALLELSPMLSEIKLSYEKGWKSDSLLEALVSTTAQDMERGATGPGPHKADLHLHLQRKVARDRISRGEQKILSAALLLSQASLMADSGEIPVLLMDDLASEFDQTHLSRVLELAGKLDAQILITGTGLEPYGQQSDGEHGLFHVEQGIITTETIT
jgi:DNA replication and repair protein RecF